MKQTIPAVIFAGGKSSRMGTDKATLPFGNYGSLAEYQYRRLKKIFRNVYIGSKTEKFDFDAPLILDRYAASSPMSGLVSAFETLEGAEAIFVLSVDAPFIDKTVITALLDAERHADAVIARCCQKVQPLCGLYRRSCLPYAKSALEADKHKMGMLLDAFDTYYVDFEEREAFLNLNHPEEYEAALKLIGS